MKKLLDWLFKRKEQEPRRMTKDELRAELKRRCKQAHEGGKMVEAMKRAAEK